MEAIGEYWFNMTKVWFFVSNYYFGVLIEVSPDFIATELFSKNYVG